MTFCATRRLGLRDGGLARLLLIVFLLLIPSTESVALGQWKRGATPRLQKRVEAKLLRWKDELSQRTSSGGSGQAALIPEPAEPCALYTDECLDEEEIDDLRRQGIEVSHVWIPPIPGRHPLGYHLVQVPVTVVADLARWSRVHRLDTSVLTGRFCNDRAAVMTGVDRVWAGVAPSPVGTATTGAGVRVAVADSGLTTCHADIPTDLIEGYDVTTGEGVAEWSQSVFDAGYSGHGTHVTASLCGNGSMSGGRYQGVAPGVSLAFYKVENSDGEILQEDVIEAIVRAHAMGCKVMNLSLGFVTPYRDGSGLLAQAVDTVAQNGMLCVCSAGNEAFNTRFAFAEVAGGASSVVLPFTISNAYSSEELNWVTGFEVSWRDGVADGQNLSLSCLNLDADERVQNHDYSASPRGTELVDATLKVKIPAGQTKTYQLVLKNGLDAATARAQIYCYCLGDFDESYPTALVLSPALADGALAVGAVVHRKSFDNMFGESVTISGETVGEPASFTSPGPRIDGLRKPELGAPGSFTISAFDPDAWWDWYMIDDDDVIDGMGPGNYIAMEGTSMASPHVAGIAALLFEAAPWLTPVQAKELLMRTADHASAPDDILGNGCVNVVAALAALPPPPNPYHEIPGGCRISTGEPAGLGIGLVACLVLLLLGLFRRRAEP